MELKEAYDNMTTYQKTFIAKDSVALLDAYIAKIDELQAIADNEKANEDAGEKTDESDPVTFDFYTKRLGSLLPVGGGSCVYGGIRNASRHSDRALHHGSNIFHDELFTCFFSGGNGGRNSRRRDRICACEPDPHADFDCTRDRLRCDLALLINL